MHSRWLLQSNTILEIRIKMQPTKSKIYFVKFKEIFLNCESDSVSPYRVIGIQFLKTA